MRSPGAVVHCTGTVNVVEPVTVMKNESLTDLDKPVVGSLKIPPLTPVIVAKNTDPCTPGNAVLTVTVQGLPVAILAMARPVGAAKSNKLKGAFKLPKFRFRMTLPATVHLLMPPKSTAGTFAGGELLSM